MHRVIMLYHLLCRNAEFGGSKLLAVFLVTKWRLCGSCVYCATDISKLLSVLPTMLTVFFFLLICMPIVQCNTLV